MNRIEELLEINTKDKPSSILLAQWEFDKKIIPSSLRAVAGMFSHYSLHDETHSETIIANFIKLIGEDAIEELSGTDLWLLLEAAYCHDLGMVITADRVKEAIDSGKVQEHINWIRKTSYHDLHDWAQELEIKDNKIHFKETAFELKKIDAAKFLFADYFRNHHANLSAEHIQHPFDKIGMDSPRVLIPQRLYDMLGRICSAHTQDFSKVMELPENEDGIDTEVAHPRFIACLLRLADLLDIDNGRFGETLLRLHSCLPDSTDDHKDKHMSIKHKSVNDQEIEIIAECSRKEVAHITQEWFEWIRQEFTNQTLVWKDIVPAFLGCSLPSIKQLRVDLKGYEYFDKKNKPVFTVDTPKALELLQGANFYDSPFTSIRELLQNAVDATLIRIWEEYKYKFDEIDTILKLVEVAKKYPIEIFFEDNTDGIVHITIADSGTGISRNDLKFLSNTGSSSTNTDRRSIIDEIPLWMQPAGIFGIGFQSVFLLANMVTISTKPVFADEVKYVVEMHNPGSKFKGDIYIKPVDEKELKKENKTLISKLNNGGSIVEFDIKLTDEELNKLGRLKWEDPFVEKAKLTEEEEKQQKKNENLSAIKQMLEESILEYAKYSFIPIVIEGKVQERRKATYTTSDNGVEFFMSNDIDYYGPVGYIYSKNAFVKDINMRFLGKNTFVDINIHNIKAKNFLNISRNAIVAGKEDFVNQNICEAAKDVFEKQILSDTRTVEEVMSENKYLEDFVAFLYYTNHNDKELDNNLLPYVKYVDIAKKRYDSKIADSLLIKDILSDRIVIEKERDDDFFCKGVRIDIDYIKLILKISGDVVSVSTNYADEQVECTIDKENVNYSNYLEHLKRRNNIYMFDEEYFPCDEKYKELRIKQNVEKPIRFGSEFTFSTDYILSPVRYLYNGGDRLLKDRRNDLFYNWVMENKADKSVTREQVVEAYDKLYNELQEIFKKVKEEEEKEKTD